MRLQRAAMCAQRDELLRSTSDSPASQCSKQKLRLTAGARERTAAIPVFRGAPAIGNASHTTPRCTGCATLLRASRSQFACLPDAHTRWPPGRRTPRSPGTDCDRSFVQRRSSSPAIHEPARRCPSLPARRSVFRRQLSDAWTRAAQVRFLSVPLHARRITRSVEPRFCTDGRGRQPVSCGHSGYACAGTDDSRLGPPDNVTLLRVNDLAFRRYPAAAQSYTRTVRRRFQKRSCGVSASPPCPRDASRTRAAHPARQRHCTRPDSSRAPWSRPGCEGVRRCHVAHSSARSNAPGDFRVGQIEVVVSAVRCDAFH